MKQIGQLLDRLPTRYLTPTPAPGLTPAPGSTPTPGLTPSPGSTPHPQQVDHASRVITDLTDDSRAMSGDPASCLFIARHSQYIQAAIALGCKTILASQTEQVALQNLAQTHRDVTFVTLPTLNQQIAGQIAQRLWDFPASQLKIIAVTGTNGKTTVCQMLAHLLRQADLPCGIVGTLFIDDGITQSPATLTTPGAIELVRIFKQMVRQGCQAVALEASSHALDQGRLAAFDIHTAIFTNLTGDHLDYHPSMHHYAHAKAKLFEQLTCDGHAVVNGDDPYAQTMVQNCPGKVRQCVVLDHNQELAGLQAGYHAQIQQLAAGGSVAHYDGLSLGKITLHLPMVGRHNVENALLALVAADTVKTLSKQNALALETLPAVPGRLQAIHLPASPLGQRLEQPSVFVDYAHTHDALENVLNALRPITRGQLWCLVGCGGDRDRTKRPRMAQVACRLADRVIFTSDNPRSENPDAILADMLEGVPDGCHGPHVEPDRKQAVIDAITQALPGDTVLIAGKGHETTQVIGNQTHHFDDRLEALAALGSVGKPLVGQASRLSSAPTADPRLQTGVFRQSLGSVSKHPMDSVRQNFKPPHAPWTLDHIQKLTRGRWLAQPDNLDHPYTGLSIDSRTIERGQIYLAIAGDRFDGHDFVEQAAQKGACLAIVSQQIKLPCLDNLPQGGQGFCVLQVDDTLTALQTLGKAWRSELAKHDVKVMAVAGSNGKTTTRHIICTLLSQSFRGSQSPKSFNNHIGVPLTLLGAKCSDDFVVVEIGTNHPGEVAKLAELVRPNVAVIASIGKEHLEFFGGLDNVAKEQASLCASIDEAGILLLPTGVQQQYPNLFMPPARGLLIHFGLAESADGWAIGQAHLVAGHVDLQANQIKMTTQPPGMSFGVQAQASETSFLTQANINPLHAAIFHLPLLGKPNVANTLAGIGVGLSMGMHPQAIAKAMAHLQPMPMRLQVLTLENDSPHSHSHSHSQPRSRSQPHSHSQPPQSITIIHDAYNANPDSMAMALQVLKDWPVDVALSNLPSRRVAILGDMLELGPNAQLLHRQLADHIDSSIDLVITIGSLAAALGEVLTQTQVACFDLQDEKMPTQVVTLLQAGDLVLLKASRSIALEKLLPVMCQQCHMKIKQNAK